MKTYSPVTPASMLAIADCDVIVVISNDGFVEVQFAQARQKSDKTADFYIFWQSSA